MHLNRKLTQVAAAALICGAAAVAPLLAPRVSDAAAKKADEPAPIKYPTVIQFRGSQMVKANGKEMLMVAGIAGLTGQPFQGAVVAEDASAKKYEPKGEIASTIKAAKPGDYIQMDVDPKNGQTWITKAEAYKLTEGEELPNVFIFDDGFSKKEGEQEVYVVTLKKFAHVIDSIVTMSPGPSKQMVPDAAMVERLGKMKKGDLLEAELRPGPGPYQLMTSADAYAAPQEAKLVKIGEGEVEGGKGPVVELDQDGKTLSLPIVGKLVSKKWTPDALVVSAAKRFKPGATVLFRTRESDGKTWLRSIQPAPKPAAATKTPGAGTAGATKGK